MAFSKLRAQVEDPLMQLSFADDDSIWQISISKSSLLTHSSSSKQSSVTASGLEEPRNAAEHKFLVLWK